MANVKNLKRGNPKTQFKTGKKQVEIAKKGGKASGVAKRKKKAEKEEIRRAADIALTMLKAPVSDKNKATLEAYGINKGDANYLAAMIAGVIKNVTTRGDYKGLEKVLKIVGQDEKTNFDIEAKKKELEYKQKEIEFRERELSLREKEFEYKVAFEKGEIKEEERVVIVNDLDELVRNGKGS